MAKFWVVAAALALGGATLIGVTGCAEIGDRILYGSPTERPKSNLEYQRESALRFRTGWANVQRLRFTDEGNKPGLTSWSANAVATIDGTDYHVIIGPNTTAFLQGDPPPREPTLPPPAPPVALTVVYSDGTTEVIE